MFIILEFSFGIFFVNSTESITVTLICLIDDKKKIL